MLSDCIVEPLEIESTLITDSLIHQYDIGNPFKIWLKAKALRMVEAKIEESIYLKRIIE